MKIKLELFGASRDFSDKDHLELEVQELAGEHLVLDNAAEVGLNGPLRGLCAGISLADAPPGIGRQSLHTTETRITTC